MRKIIIIIIKIIIIIVTCGVSQVFTWSASGTIMTETLAATLPTVVVYVIDTPRCASPVTFMSNMLYACSILYKSKLPFVLAFNKTDVVWARGHMPGVTRTGRPRLCGGVDDRSERTARCP